MKNLFDKNTTKKIEKLNEASGLNHRARPYNINDKDDLEEMLKIKVCALSDYSEYDSRLDSILELLDESIEYFDTSTWLNITMDVNESDKLLLKCYDSTRKASDNFQKLTNRTKKEVLEVLNIIANSSEDIQIGILGFSLSKYKNIKKKLEAAIDNAYEIEYEYNMEQAFEKFKEYLKNHLTEEEQN